MSNLEEQKDIILEALRPVRITLNDVRYVPFDAVETEVDTLCSVVYSEGYSDGLKKNISDHFKDISEIRVMMIDEVIEQLQSMRTKELDRHPLVENTDDTNNYEYDRGRREGIQIGRHQVLNDLFTLFEEADDCIPKVAIYDCIMEYLKEQDKERWDALCKSESQRSWTNLS